MPRKNKNPLTGKPYNSNKSVAGMAKRAAGMLVQDYGNYMKAVGGVAQRAGSYVGKKIRDASGNAPAKKMKKTISKISHRESSPLAKSPKPKHI
jgi:hypothetical protein|tara:strand:+ start:5474 stop:5755 length:282 start_codon:yes stop_codon:yes gene_type:complete